MKDIVLSFVHGMVETFVVATSFVVEKVKGAFSWSLETNLLASPVTSEPDYTAELELEMELNRKHQGVK
jgi:hypothetical protein